MFGIVEDSRLKNAGIDRPDHDSGSDVGLEHIIMGVVRYDRLRGDE